MEAHDFIRVRFQKVNYLKQINGYSTPTQTIRKTIEKEYRKEKIEGNGKP